MTATKLSDSTIRGRQPKIYGTQRNNNQHQTFLILRTPGSLIRLRMSKLQRPLLCLIDVQKGSPPTSHE